MNDEPTGLLGQPSGSRQRSNKRRQAGSWAVRNNFSRMASTFGTTAVLTRPEVDAHGHPLPPVSDAKPLVESDVLGKVGLLTLIAIGFGGISFVFPVSIGFALVCIFVAFALALWTTFRPHMARTLAPIYAGTEGLALGVLSRLYSAQSHGIVPLAIILTGALFIGVLFSYRTGLVRVTNRFISMTIVAGFALLAVMLATLLGLRFPGLGSSATGLIVFGVVYLVVAILDLFVDFELVNRAAKAGVSADAEWYAAFSIFLAVVMLYLGLLRILGGARR
ncbi:MAG TPA: Bax inhibitor-1/YccA family protein [Acidimicrobiales bacterium]|jgi:uncharacterized YccA/Bax inhibitor family protein|nr:Bax inhibitor-1/YccA family protein [Acidimicrobiales bacterium]